MTTIKLKNLWNELKFYIHWWLDISAREKVSYIQPWFYVQIFPLRLYPTKIRANFCLAPIPNHTIFKVSRIALALISNHVFEKKCPLRLYPTKSPCAYIQPPVNSYRRFYFYISPPHILISYIRLLSVIFASYQWFLSGFCLLVKW